MLNNTICPDAALCPPKLYDQSSSNATSTGNETLPGVHYHIVFKIFAATVMVIITIAALLGNLLVLYAFFNYHRLRNNVTNYYIASLALSDLLTAALVIPLEIDTFINDSIWKKGETMCRIWTTLYLLAAPGSIINLCAVTLDRFIVLRVPLRYTELMTPRKAVIVIVCLWVYALVTACLPVMGWKNTDHNNVLQGECYFNMTPEYTTLMNIVNFLIPMIFMAICWSLIYQIARKHQRRVKRLARSMSVNETTMSLTMNGVNGVSGRPSISDGTQTKKSIKKHLKGSKYIAIIVGVFFVCWLPYTLLSLSVSVCGDKCYYATPRELAIMLLIMGYLNSALNPYLYPFHDRQFKEAFKNILFDVQNLTIWEIFRRKESR